MGAGAIPVAPLVAGRGPATRRSRLVAIAMVAYGLALIALGLNGVIGVGIFFVPNKVAAIVPGPAGALPARQNLPSPSRHAGHSPPWVRKRREASRS